MQIVALALAAALFSPLAQDADIRLPDDVKLPGDVQVIVNDEVLNLVDYVEVVVNDEILTWRQVLGATVKKIPEGTQPTNQQLNALRNSVGNDLINERLQMQGGMDMGFKSQLVERIINGNIERQIDAAGGIIQMADALVARNLALDEIGRELSLNDQKARMKRDLYRHSWERAITGVGEGAFGRTYRDRYVRPGKLQLYHEQLKHGRLGAEAIGGKSALYTLQELTLADLEHDKAEELRVQAERLYRDLSKGADLTNLIRTQGHRPINDGIGHPMTGLDLARSGGPEVAAFALSAALGELSRPMPVLFKSRLVGWRIMKLIKAEKPILPIFNLPQTQSALRKALQAKTDEHRRERGLEALNDGAYVWLAAEDQNT